MGALAVADHVGCRRQFCKQEDKKKRVNEVDTWQARLNSSAQATSSGLFWANWGLRGYKSRGKNGGRSGYGPAEQGDFREDFITLLRL